METVYDRKFVRQLRKLPPALQVIAVERELLFRADPFAAQLDTHKLHGDLRNFWSFSISKSFRVIFRFGKNNIVHFYQIGDHRIYNI